MLLPFLKDDDWRKKDKTQKPSTNCAGCWCTKWSRTRGYYEDCAVLMEEERIRVNKSFQRSNQSKGRTDKQPATRSRAYSETLKASGCTTCRKRLVAIRELSKKMHLGYTNYNPKHTIHLRPNKKWQSNRKCADRPGTLRVFTRYFERVREQRQNLEHRDRCSVRTKLTRKQTCPPKTISGVAHPPLANTHHFS